MGGARNRPNPLFAEGWSAATPLSKQGARAGPTQSTGLHFHGAISLSDGGEKCEMAEQ